jgi:hypothetical protein
VTDQPPAEPGREQPQPTGSRLIGGRYRLRRVLGRGAMGVVWLGYDEVLHRQVAVKEVQLPDGMPEGEASEARERTLREARAIAALTHPNVVAVYDVAKEGVEPFVVMEWLRGRSLAQVIGRTGRLTAEQAAVVADAVAAALDTAHRRGIIHRDVKSGNVLVGEDGQVKLTDFGISRNISEVTLTSSGMILGTPAFMAPEVAAGEETTGAADLWSFGATLFAGVEGRPPYDAGDVMATVHEVVHGEIPRPAPDAPLADVITGLMARDPAERMSLVEVRRRIRPLLPDPGTLVFPPDEAEATAGPVDNKPTTNLAAPRAKPERPARPRQQAAEPGPLPWQQAPAAPPIPRRVVVRQRHRIVTAALLVIAAALFVVAAGVGFGATRMLAGHGVLPVPPPTSVPTTTPTTSPTSGVRLRSVRQVAAVHGVANSGFALSVPAGWSKFVEQRGRQGTLPDSTIIRWVKSDGTAEVAVQRFGDFYPHDPTDYYAALQTSERTGVLLQNGDGSVYLWRSLQTKRSTYLELVQPDGDPDLWVVSLAVPTVQEGGATLDLFDQIRQTFQVTGTP